MKKDKGKFEFLCETPPKPSYPSPTVERPSDEQLTSSFDIGVVQATDGCVVELDGTCPHGHPSWFLYLNIIE